MWAGSERRHVAGAGTGRRTFPCGGLAQGLLTPLGVVAMMLCIFAADGGVPLPLLGDLDGQFGHSTTSVGLTE